MSQTPTTPGTAVAEQKPQTNLQKFSTSLPKYEKNIADLLQSKGMSAQEFMVTVQTEVRRNPQLADCDLKSVFGAILLSAELGLPISSARGFAYLIPYNRSVKDGNGNWTKVKDAQFIVGYQGFREIVMRNPNLVDIESDVVYEKDEFVYEKGFEPKFKHVPSPLANRGKRLYAYAIAYFKDDTRPKIVVVTGSQIDLIKKISSGAAQSSSPWANEEKDPFGWMWRKTAIKQLCKELPKLFADPNIAKAIQADNASEVAGRVVATEEGVAEVIIENNPNATLDNEAFNEVQDAVVVNDAKPVAMSAEHQEATVSAMQPSNEFDSNKGAESAPVNAVPMQNTKAAGKKGTEPTPKLEM